MYGMRECGPNSDTVRRESTINSPRAVTEREVLSELESAHQISTVNNSIYKRSYLIFTVSHRHVGLLVFKTGSGGFTFLVSKLQDTHNRVWQD